VKKYIHARLSREERMALDRLRAATGRSESDLVRLGMKLVERELTGEPSALDRAGKSVGRFPGGPHDLSTNRRHLDHFGQ
jgi:hypothetical protein